MNTLRNARLLSLACAAVLLTACGGEATSDATVAAADEPAVIDERQENFETLGDGFKAVRTQLESDAPDTAVILQAANDMNAAAQKVEGYFPAGTSVDDGYDTEALAAIWEKPDEFAEANRMLVEATGEMVTLAEGGDIAAMGGQVANVGKSCKNCHDNFRLDTD